MYGYATIVKQSGMYIYQVMVLLFPTNFVLIL